MITGKDMTTIMDLLVAAYGEKSYPLSDPVQMTKMTHLWSVMFRDDEADEVLLAVKNCIATLSFPPKIADIKSRIAQSRMSGQMTEMEAWAKIRDAVKNATNRSDANKSFTELPPILQKCVGTPSQLRAWNSVSIDTFEGVIASNVQRSYRESAKNEATYYALPKDMQESQKWMVKAPSDVQMLPEPEPQKSLEEILSDMEAYGLDYRARNGIETNPAYEDRVADFKKPLTEDELKMIEAKQKKKDADRLERMRE